MTESELSDIRDYLTSASALPSTAHARAMRMLLAEVGRLRAELAGRRVGEGRLAVLRRDVESRRDGFGITDGVPVELLAHVDYLEGVICDLLNEDGRALREAGAAEERARIVDVVRVFALSSGSACLAIIQSLPPLPDLLPPQEARAALDAERAKVARLRAALDLILERRGLEAIREIAREALKKVENMEAKTDA